MIFGWIFNGQIHRVAVWNKLSKFEHLLRNSKNTGISYASSIANTSFLKTPKIGPKFTKMTRGIQKEFLYQS